MQKYEIKYKHYDMPDDYIGRKLLWARDSKSALGYFLQSKPSPDGLGKTKKGKATVIILEVNEISTTE
jgi:hypothetical protein